VITLALVAGATVWLAIAVYSLAWLTVLALVRGARPGPRSVVRWFLASWLPRLAIVAAWGAAGWHVFCQRP
jgi:hypothetical protein